MAAAVGLAIESLEARVHLSATLIKDVNTTPSAGVAPGPLVRVGGVAYFPATDGVNGSELWKTDGSAAGTVLVADVWPGAGGSSPTLITDVGGTAYFVADDGAHGAELWRTDGTAWGTVLVKDIYAGATGSAPSLLSAAGSVLYFFADDGVHGRELWRSDGSEAGTVMVADLRAGAVGQSPYGLLGMPDGTAFFSAWDWVGNVNALWKTDGTAAGTSMVSGAVGWRLYAGGLRVFFADSSTYALRVTDGTPGGTVLVQDPGASSQIPEWAAGGDGTVYFARTGAGAGLYRVAAGATAPQAITETGSGLVFTDASDLVVVDDGTLYFVATGWNVGRELYRVAPGASTASLVKETVAGSASGLPDNVVAVGGALYFTTGVAGTTEYALWRSDGSAGGTGMVTTIAARNARAPGSLLGLGSALLLVNDDGVEGAEVWRSDGTAAGTGLVKAIYPGSEPSNPSFWGAVGGAMLFTVKDAGGGLDLWRTDGTGAGTALVYDAWPGDALKPQNVRIVGDVAYFAAGTGATGLELWVTDGTTAGTRMVKDINAGAGASTPALFTAGPGGWTYFVAGDGVHGKEWWRTDGTSEGTSMVVDVRPGSADGASGFGAPVLMNGVLYFTAHNASGLFDRDLWRTDGTAGGTSLVYATPGGVSARWIEDGMLALGDTLLFARGAELWRSDGTAVGTVQVKTFGTSSTSGPDYLTRVGDAVYFAAPGGLWRSDGAEAGTTLVAPVLPYLGITAMNGEVYFRSSTGRVTGEGLVLWRSDGTAEGTVLFGHVNQLIDSPYPSALVPANGRLFFVNKVAKTGGAGAELWVTDGTAEGTRMVQDLNPGTGDGALTGLAAFGGAIYFAGNDGVRGYEPYLLPDTFAPRVRSGQFEFQRGQAVRVRFSEDVSASLASAEVVVTNLTTGTAIADANIRRAYDAGTLTATYTFVGLPGGVLPDGNYRLTIRAASVKDAAGNALAADFAVDFFILAGDANRDRVVNFADLLALAKNYNTTGGATLAQGDFNGDGAVNFADLLILAKHYNTALAAPPPEPAPAMASVSSSSSSSSSSSVLKKAAPVAKPAPPKRVAPGRFSSRRVR